VASDLAAEFVRELAAALPEPLNTELVDAIARVVVELSREPDGAGRDRGPELLTVADVAARLKVSPKWVYAHQHELGPIRLGDGPRARLRFDADVIDSRITDRRHTDGEPLSDPSEVSTEPARRARRRLASRPLPPNLPARSRR
jgi:hypothetical protein